MVKFKKFLFGIYRDNGIMVVEDMRSTGQGGSLDNYLSSDFNRPFIKPNANTKYVSTSSRQPYSNVYLSTIRSRILSFSWVSIDHIRLG
jgi:hypothetical protein